jgi:hypothetical protein
MERNIVIGALAALFIGVAGYVLLHKKSLCVTGTYYKLCASSNTTPTPGLAGVTVTKSVLSTNVNAITYSDGTTNVYDQGSLGYGFKVGDCVYNDNKC